MERKNLVILVDNGIGTEKELLPGKPQTKGEIIKDAVIQSLGTLTENDKVNAVMLFFCFFLFSFTSLSRLFQLIRDWPISRWGENGRTPRKTT